MYPCVCVSCVAALAVNTQRVTCCDCYILYYVWIDHVCNLVCMMVIVHTFNQHVVYHPQCRILAGYIFIWYYCVCSLWDPRRTKSWMVNGECEWRVLHVGSLERFGLWASHVAGVCLGTLESFDRSIVCVCNMSFVFVGLCWESACVRWRCIGICFWLSVHSRLRWKKYASVDLII